MLPFRLITNLLWAALGVAWTFALVSEFCPVSLLLLVFGAIAQFVWLTVNIKQLGKSYSRNEVEASSESPRDRLVWGANRKPRPADAAPGVLILGLAGFYMAYDFSQGAVPTKFLRLVYELFGTTGVVGLFSLIGVAGFAVGVEMLLGARGK